MLTPFGVTKSCSAIDQIEVDLGHDQNGDRYSDDDSQSVPHTWKQKFGLRSQQHRSHWKKCTVIVFKTVK